MIAVEGYIDVIAMVTAGFEATVAPLGTALTADQLALMWRMADEPILCFDGDDAGRRAAYRALDLALPLVKPGKSLKFAALPDGQDPDDLVRSGGREAVEDVLSGARPLADMLWTRESEAGPFNTPERRAALEARLAEVTATIADETVRRYYRQDFAARLRRAVRAGGGRGAPPHWGRPTGKATGKANWDDRGRRPGGVDRNAPPRAAFGRDEGYVAASPHLVAEPAASRPSHRHPAPRGADPAGGAQSPVASARSHGGIGRNRVPPRRYEKAQGGPDRHPRPPVRSRAGQEPHEAGHETEADRAELIAELTRAGFADLLGAHRAHHHHAVGLGRAAGGRAERCFADLEAASCLASAMAFPN